MKTIMCGLCMLLASVGVRAQALAPKAISYSSMKYLPGPDDLIGWDVKVRAVTDGFDAVLYCGVGVIEGPVRVHLPSITGKQMVKPASDVCGRTLTLEFRGPLLFVTVEEGSRDRVPRHKNYYDEDRFR